MHIFKCAVQHCTHSLRTATGQELHALLFSNSVWVNVVNFELINMEGICETGPPPFFRRCKLGLAVFFFSAFLVPHINPTNRYVG